MGDIEKPEVRAAKEAIGLLGGPVRAAERLGFGKRKYQLIQSWMRNGIPAARCPTIERATAGAIRCEDLRPDVDWAYLRGTAHETAKEAANV